MSLTGTRFEGVSSPEFKHEYQPVGNLQQVFYSFDREILVCGPSGTGKSRACLERIVQLALTYPGSRFLLVRKTAATINISTAVTLKDHVIPHLISSGVVIHKGTSSKQPAQYQFSNGSVILTAGMDDPEKVKSTEFDVIYVNEATELAEEDWDILLTRIRNNKVPFQQILADCNPSYPYHWLKKRADAGTVLMISTTHKDNPRLWLDDKWTPEGRTYLKGLASASGVRRERNYLGKWAAAEGLVYDSFDENIHITTQKIPATWPRYWSVDFGFTDPFVCQIWAIDPDGRMILEHEVYMTGKTIAEHCKTLSQFARRHRPKAVVCDSASPEGMEQIRKELSVNVVKAKKDIAIGINLVKERLKLDADGKPKLSLHKNALVSQDKDLAASNQPTQTAEEFLAYAWHKNKPDVPGDKFNHGMDAMRYMVAHLDHKVTPRIRWVEF